MSKNLKHLFHFSTTSYRTVLVKFQIKLLNIEIEDLSIHIFYLNNKLISLKIKIEEVLPNNITGKFYEMQNTYDQKIQKEFSEKHNRKLMLLIPNFFQSSDVNINELTDYNQDLRSRWVQNLTDVDVPQSVLDVLSLGEKFNVESKLNTKDKIELIKNLEHMLWVYNFSVDV